MMPEAVFGFFASPHPAITQQIPMAKASRANEPRLNEKRIMEIPD
jgi:hypothetical protein